MEKKAASTAPKAMKRDNFGNPEGTTYSQDGTATHAEYDGLNNAPQPAEGTQFMYEENGSIFTPPADAEKTIGVLKADIAGLKMAIGKRENSVAGAQAMMAEADDESKPIFQKNIDNVKVAIESDKAVITSKEQEISNLRLSLITPDQRRVERELQGLYKQREDTAAKIAVLENTKKAWGIPEDKGAPKAGGTSAAAALSTDEQKANLKAAIEAHGTQGKAIVAMVKEGKTNTEIYKHFGIPPASVPGPKNAFLNSEAGAAWKAANVELAAKVA